MKLSSLLQSDLPPFLLDPVLNLVISQQEALEINKYVLKAKPGPQGQISVPIRLSDAVSRLHLWLMDVHHPLQ